MQSMSQGRDELLRQIFDDGDVITTDGFLRAFENSPSVAYVKRDFIFRGGTWRGSRAKTAWRARAEGKRVLLTGHSDIHLRAPHALMLKAMGFNFVRGMNVDPVGTFAQPLPAGLTNDCDDSPLHPLLGDQVFPSNSLRDNDRSDEYADVLYGAWSVRTYPAERSPLRSALAELPGFVWEETEVTPEGRRRYFSNLRTANFVVCPRGNGLDTHRVWETLYVGGFPIVKRVPMMEVLTAGLPVWTVDAWDEVLDRRKREKAWHRLQSQAPDFDRLRLSSWVASIQALGS